MLNASGHLHLYVTSTRVGRALVIFAYYSTMRCRLPPVPPAVAMAPQVGDFGLARSLAGEDCIDTASVGTVTHMPPEVLVDGKQTKVKGGGGGGEVGR